MIARATAAELGMRGGGRFRLAASLGAGAMGVVWEAVDLDGGGRVALKTMPGVDGQALWRFKREFRLLRDLRHAGLVAMHELVRDEVGWFFTMERVDGVPFVEHVAPDRVSVTRADSVDDDAPHATGPGEAAAASSRPLDAARVRDAIGRLADALEHLHAVGLVHRDIKPSNVLVEPGGRVVVLDFGLTIEALRAGRGGTLAYMAPEQHRGAPLTGAVDLFAVGVMLHQSLTGRVPFWADLAAEMVVAKERGATPLLDEARDVDDELADLCRGLLAPDPAARPTAGELGRRVGRRRPTIGPLRPGRMVGRAAELAALDQVRAAVGASGATRAVAVIGEAGIGKTALVDHFVHRAAADGALVLVARCSERERVPFRAVDGLVDDLAQWLGSLPAADRAPMLTADCALLGAAFPVMAAHASSEPPAIAVPRERRERMFAAFRGLLAAAAARTPTIVWLDDAQWADDDSIALLIAALSPPASPLLLVIGTRDAPPPWLPVAAEPITLGPLSAADATELVRALAPELDAARLVQAAAGHPLYLAELAGSGSGGGATASLAELLSRHVTALTDETRGVLERIAVAGGPLRREVLAEAAGDEVALGAALSTLRRQRLVVSAPYRGAVAFDVFHARVRDVVASALDPGRRHRHHAALAAAVERRDPADVEALATHWEGAGEPGRAFDHAVAAARAADTALAFERAARWYRRALGLGERAGVAVHRVGAVCADLGAALANLGRGLEAAAAFERAADAAADRDAAAAAELRRRAAEQLLLSGHIGRGLALLHGELRAVGLAPPPTGRRALFALARARLAARRIDLEAALPAASDDAITRRRIDTSWSVAQGLVLVDTFAGAVGQSQHLTLAMRAGEPYRAARALALEASYLAAMRGGADRSDRALAAAARAARLCEDPHPGALVAVADSVGAYFRGRYADGLRLGAAAEEVLTTRCAGAVWELGVVRHHMLLDLVYMGEMAEARRRLAVLLADARGRGDRYAEIYLRTGVAPFCALVEGDARACRDGALAAVAEWAQPRWVVQTYAALMAVVQGHLYDGDGDAAAAELAARWPALARSLLLGVSLVRVEAWRLRARVALTRAAGSRGLARHRHGFAAARAIRVMAAEPGVPAQPFALLSRAGLASVRGDDDGARRGLERAALAFDGADMRLMAACARRRHGMLVGGAAGAAEIAAADAWMQAQTIADPARMTACLAPGPA